jgi:uncharacterized repeat protein (TIGR01451 family)
VALVSLIIQSFLPGIAYGKTSEVREAIPVPKTETAAFADNQIAVSPVEVADPVKTEPTIETAPTGTPVAPAVTEPSIEETPSVEEPCLKDSAVADCQEEPLNTPKNHPTISLEKAVDLATAHPGDLLTYSLTWAVGGTGYVTELTLTDAVPVDVNPVGDLDGGVYTVMNRTITWELGPQDAGNHGTIEWTGTLANPLPNGYQVTNTATLEAANLDPVSDSANTTIVSSPAIGLEKAVSAEIAAPGSMLTYTLSWNISGTAGAQDLVLSDPIPANLTFATISSGGVYDPNLHLIRWDLGDRQPGEHGSVQWSAEVAAPLNNGTIIKNVATLSAIEVDPVKASASTTITSIAMLHLDKTVSPTLAQPNDSVTYTLAWSVTGTSAVTNLVLVDPLPAGLTYVSSTHSGAYASPDRLIRWNLGTAQPGDAGQVSVTATVASTAAVGSSLDNTATLSATAAQSVSDTASLAVGGQPKLTIKKTVNDKSVRPGDTILYTVVVSNTGTAEAKDVKVVDVLPAGFVFLESGDTDRAFALGTLEAESSRTLTFSVVIETDTKPGNYQNVATVSASNSPSRNAKVTVEVLALAPATGLPQPHVTLSKVANRTTVPIGGVVTYTLTVRNDGLAPAYNLRLTDVIPAGLAFIDFVGSTATWRLGDLLPGHERILHVDVRVSATALAGQHINTARVVGDNMATLVATAAITVQRGQVLGALTETGAGPFERGLMAIGVLSLFLGLELLIRRRV